MTPDKLRGLRIRFRNVLWRRFPQADAVTIGQGTNELVNIAVREAFNLVDMPHAIDCVCWNCVLALNAEVVERVARQRAAHEAADDYD